MHLKRGNTTLSFEVSIIDVAMLIAIIVLFTLYLTNSSKEKTVSIIRKARPRKETAKRPNFQKDTSNKMKETLECPHFFGYLKTREKKGVPEECVGCTKLVECLVMKK
ncbi:MAG: hypothetical protein QXX08_06720 [Candidatus Bathyarchaeia archaeon]